MTANRLTCKWMIWTNTPTFSLMQRASISHTQVSSKQTSTQMRLYKLKIPLLPLVVDEEAEVAHQVLPFLYINP